MTRHDTLYLKFEVSRKRSNKGEKTKDRDHEKLEAVSGKSEVVNSLNFNIRDGRWIGLGLGRSSKENGDGGTLLALKISKSIIVSEISLGLHKSGLGSLGVESGVTLLLELGVGEIRDDPFADRGLVSASGDTADLEVLGSSPSGVGGAVAL